MAQVRIEELTVQFSGGTRALDRLGLAIEDGEFFALLGPSGCGKTTLLRTIAGLVLPSAGRVVIGERDVTRLPPGDRNVAMVFQDYALYPHMTVAENIAYPLKVRRVERSRRQEMALSAGASLGLGELMARRPAQLSGGQQQRVALARAIATRPDVFLLDEPLSNLDARLRLEARTFLKRLQGELGITTVYVTHDQAEALAMAHRMAVMDHGVVRQVGTPVEVFQHPANLFVAQFTGSTPMNLLPARVEKGALALAGRRLPLPKGSHRLREGDRVTVGVRPEYMELSATERHDGLPGRVAVVENLGVSSLVTLEGEGISFQVVVPENRAPRAGERGWAVADPARTLLYDDRGELIRS
jgi:multiple sugar transport system ATP-binding protein